MIGQSVRLISIRSIKVDLHSSWFILFFLITYSLTTRFVLEYHLWTAVGLYTVGIATTPAVLYLDPPSRVGAQSRGAAMTPIDRLRSQWGTPC